MAFGGGTVKYIVGGQEVGNVYYSTNPIIFDEITNLGYDPTTAKSITYTTASGNTGTVTSSMTVYNITDYDGADSTVSIVYDEPTPANPTISQLHIDGVTYDLRDRNAGEGVTTEEKAKLAALPEAAEIPSDIGPKSEVVEEVPSEYVAGKVYFVVEGITLKSQDEIVALGGGAVSELNLYPKEYYDKFNSESKIRTSASGEVLAKHNEYVLVNGKYVIYNISTNKWFFQIISPDAP